MTSLFNLSFSLNGEAKSLELHDVRSGADIHSAFLRLAIEQYSGKIMKIKMPTTENAICQNCDELQQVIWNQFGSMIPCIACDAAPARLIKVGA
jgi:hypothetical protein